MTRELHSIRTDAAKLSLRASTERKLPDIIGYSAVFNVLSEDLGGFSERILPGAFDTTLEERGDSIKAFHNHNSDIVIGSTRKGTLELATDDHGLAHVIQPPDNEWGRPVVAAIERGDIEGMSFGFSLPHPDAATWSEIDGEPVRDVRALKLFEVSTVSSWPAYPQTSVGVRALAKALQMDADELESKLASDDPETMTELSELLTSRFATREDVETLSAKVVAQTNLDRARRVAERSGYTYESPVKESPDDVQSETLTDGTAQND